MKWLSPYKLITIQKWVLKQKPVIQESKVIYIVSITDYNLKKNVCTSTMLLNSILFQNCVDVAFFSRYIILGTMKNSLENTLVYFVAYNII